MKKIMVANRGEPVIRAVKTFRRMAIATAVVYAPEDAGAAWLSEVDYAFPLSASAPGTRSLYLDGEQILAIARANGCDAIWPAWGFLAEDAAFAESVIKAGIGWIGPAPAAMRRLGSKAAATALAKDAGVPTIPEVVVAPDEPKIAQAAKAIGYPLLLKPALGGGGQGQVVVQRPEDLAEAYALASRINSAQFQNGPILFQRYLEAARHIEVQVLSDAHDTLITFHERDCSIQRRNQKIIEESPSPALTPSQRAALQGHARRLATAAGYTSAGTIEFLFADGEFFFLEINTRLQVEHPVTEESTRWIAEGGRWRRIDLLEEMVRIARGERLRFTQETVRCIGHAVEARIYAEDPARDFHPAPGTISHLRFPVGDRFRVETALRGPGGTVESLYDPMLAKLITWGSTREAALAQLRQGLHRTTIGGVTTNLAFLARVVAESEFAAGTYSTAYVRQHPALCQMPRDNAGLAMTVAAIALYERDRVQALQRLMSGHVTNVAAVLWAVPPNGGEYCCTLFGRRATLRVAEWSPGRYLVEAQGASLGLRGVRTATDEVVLLLPDGATCAAGLTWQADRVDVALHGATYAVEWSAAGTARAVDPHAAPGGGRLVKICVAPGQMVQAGDILYITEAMKMEARIAAAFAGTVTALHAAPGTAVEPGQSILTVVREEIAQTAGTDEENDWTAEDLCAPVLRESVGSSDVVKLGDAVECIRRYFQGYDSSRDAVLLAAEQASAAVASGVGTAEQLAECLADCATAYRVLTTLFSEDHAHATIYFVEHVGVRERRLPKQTEDLLCELAQIAGFPDLRDRPMLRHAVLHWLQASRYHMEAYQDVLLVLFSSWVKKSRCDGLRLRAAVRALVDARIIQRAGAARQRWREVLRDYDWEAYYAVEMPPVAREYWDLYEQYLADPLSGIAPRMLDKMRAAVAAVRMLSPPDPAGPRRPLGRGSWPGLSTEAATWLAKWFDGDSIQSLPVSRAAAEAGVRLFVSTIPIRLIAAAILPQTAGAEQGAAPATLPIVERAAIESYWMLRAYRTLGLEGELNHVFLFLPESFAVSDLPAGTTRQVARRVAGFARRLRIAATEVVVSIAGERRLVQIWHAREVGVVSRPPMALAERLPENAVVGERAADLRQQRLGKLLNRDRARILFDDGAFEELSFPDVDINQAHSADEGGATRASPAGGATRAPVEDINQAEPIGLNVYRGRINGADLLCYAGDFRHRGGALGEREGKKLAASVVLAYVMQVPIIGIHDGAGANIKGSVASLGWAGAYFGAIAATGGHSSPERFKWWLSNHHEREYFYKVLKHFGADIANSAAEPISIKPVIHLHLHLGAAVGMLVYGPSISSLAIMVDHPEAYRLLTGAATVERVTGEKGTNYTLGGAGVHHRLSGEIELVFPAEEAAIHGARELVTVVRAREAIPATGGIMRRVELPQPEVPVSAGIILGREAIEANVDQGIFWETRDALKHAGGLLTGYAQLAGQPAVLAVTATDYGIHHGRAFKKMQLAAAAAQDLGLPLIVAVGANWDRLYPTARVETIYQQHEMRKAIREALIPKIGIALGPRSMEQNIHEIMDLVWYVERGNETVYERQRASLLTHGVTDRFATAMDWCADILRYLRRPWEGARQLPTDDPADRLVPELAGLLPANLNRPYNMRDLIALIFDAGSFREFSPADQQPLHVGLATLCGRVVGVIADAPNVDGGAQTVVSISKFTRFHRFCARFGLPIVELNDSPAFRPGKEQEQSGIQGEGGKSIREETLSTIPKIAVTLRQNYGGRYIHANLVTLGPPRRGLIVEGARLGVMGAEGAVGVLYAKELAAIADPAAREQRKADLIAQYERNQLNPSQALSLGYADAVIPISHLRRELGKLLHSVISFLSSGEGYNSQSRR